MNTPASSQPDRPSQPGNPDWRSPAFDAADQETHLLPAFSFDAELPDDPFPPTTVIESNPAPPPRPTRQQRLARVIAPIVALALLAGIVVVLRLPDASSQPAIIQSGTGSPAPTQSGAGGDIQAYIVGAVVHPGVYPLHDGDRVDNLLQAAGGALPDADLVRVNLAAHVTDGEEVYVPRVGEPLPTGLDGGGPGKVNINTASAADMQKLLGISLTTANKIVAYRQAHGPFTAITQLLNVMSRSTYDKIKNNITI